MSRIPAEHLLLAASLAVEKARDFFHLDPKWDITIEVLRIEDAATTGRVQVQPDYYRAFIEVSEDVDSLAEAYAVGAHEAAHVALAHWHEYAEVAGIEHPAGQEYPAAFRIPHEKTTVLLEKLFLRAHPYPAEETQT